MIVYKKYHNVADLPHISGKISFTRFITGKAGREKSAPIPRFWGII